METFLSLLVENWIAIVAIAVSVVVVAVIYFSVLSRMERRVKKAWLDVYETFLSRADKIPLLVELVREEAHEEGAAVSPLEGLLQELIVARTETAGLAHPSDRKRAAEKALGEVLERVLGDVSAHGMLKKNAAILGLLKEFQMWAPRVQLAIVAYTRTLRLYRRVALGGTPDGYGEFEYDGV